MIARWLGERVRDYDEILVHLIAEATVILRARYEAVNDLAKRYKIGPEQVILPEY